MWLCVDRLERIDTGLVVLVSDEEKIYHLTRSEYVNLTGKDPAESDMLWAEIVSGRITSATYDEGETTARRAAAKARLNRLFDKH